MSTESFDRIVKWAKIINAKPNNDCTHFYLSDNEKTMIIDLARMPKMPTVLKKLSEMEKAYLFIDLNNSKSVRYYAFNISAASFLYTGEKEGELLLNLVEDDILKYIEDNISELTTEKAPLCKFVEVNKADYQKLLPPIQNGSSHRSYEGHNHRGTSAHYPFGGYAGHTTTNTSYATTYKERELFQDALYAHVKQGKTGAAVDHIRTFMAKEDLDKELLNSILKFIQTDKLDIISIKELIIATEPFKEQVSDRPALIGKFQVMVNKAKPKKAPSILKEIRINA